MSEQLPSRPRSRDSNRLRPHVVQTESAKSESGEGSSTTKRYRVVDSGRRESEYRVLSDQGSRPPSLRTSHGASVSVEHSPVSPTSRALPSSSQPQRHSRQSSASLMPPPSWARRPSSGQVGPRAEGSRRQRPSPSPYQSEGEGAKHKRRVSFNEPDREFEYWALTSRCHTRGYVGAFLKGSTAQDVLEKGPTGVHTSARTADGEAVHRFYSLVDACGDGSHYPREGQETHEKCFEPITAAEMTDEAVSDPHRRYMVRRLPQPEWTGPSPDRQYLSYLYDESIVDTSKWERGHRRQRDYRYEQWMSHKDNWPRTKLRGMTAHLDNQVRSFTERWCEVDRQLADAQAAVDDGQSRSGEIDATVDWVRSEQDRLRRSFASIDELLRALDLQMDEMPSALDRADQKATTLRSSSPSGSQRGGR